MDETNLTDLNIEGENTALEEIISGMVWTGFIWLNTGTTHRFL
jgi:hypothetical protein